MILMCSDKITVHISTEDICFLIEQYIKTNMSEATNDLLSMDYKEINKDNYKDVAVAMILNEMVIYALEQKVNEEKNV